MAKPTNYARRPSYYTYRQQMGDVGYRVPKAKKVRKRTIRTDQRELRNPGQPRVADEATEKRLTTTPRHKLV